MLRKKICKLLSVIMIATSVFGAVTPVVKADVINETILKNEKQLQEPVSYLTVETGSHRKDRQHEKCHAGTGCDRLESPSRRLCSRNRTGTP